MSSGEWGGRRVARARAIVATWLPAPCGQCGVTVDSSDEWVVGHTVARWLRPDLTWVLSNWRPEHRPCSDASSQGEVIAKARHEGARLAGFPDSAIPGRPPAFPSLPPGPGVAQRAQIETREGLSWQPDAMRAYPWLADFADVPDDASPPLWMSLPHEDAVGSYGAEACAWIESVERKTLRWWQRLAIVRQLEHRADGSLCHRTIVESASRRSGKSVRIRGMALWRLANAELIGEVQTVIHTGNDIPICREIQSRCWRWAEANWGAKSVVKANGKECVEAPDGSRWLVRSQDGVYGWEAGLAVVDEGWDVKPDTVSEGLEPAMLERLWAQLHITSTAHRRAKSTMRSRLLDALTRDDGETLLLVWAAPPDADVSDPQVWRDASPHWSEDRSRMITAKYEKALAGEVDPEADDPDPMAGFCAQYLNMWPLRERAAVRGDGLVEESAWADLAMLPDLDATPAAAAIESWFGRGVSLALAYREGDQVIVRVDDHTEMSIAISALRATGYRGRVTVGKSLMADPALRSVNRTPSAQMTSSAVADFARLLTEDVLRHDGSEHLTGQVLGVRTQPGPDGARMVSKGRSDALKAAAWAVTSARSSTGSVMRIVLPTGVAAS